MESKLMPCAHCGGNGNLSGKQHKFCGHRDNGLKVIRWKLLYRCGKCKATSAPIITEPTHENYWDYHRSRHDCFFTEYDNKAKAAWNRRSADDHK